VNQEPDNYYSSGYTGATLTIAPKPITVTANAQTKVSGAADPALTYRLTSGALVGSDAFRGALTRTPGESVGTYPITNTLASGALTAGPNYALTYVGANLSISAPLQAPQTITFAPLPAKTFGDADFLVSATAALPVSFAVTGNGTLLPDGRTVRLTGAGSVTVTATQAGNASYLPAPAVAQTFAVAKAPATLALIQAALSQPYSGAPAPVGFNTTPANLAGVVLKPTWRE
jgi:hypothetical protein